MKGDYEFLKRKDLKMEERIRNHFEREKEWSDKMDDMT